jgi:hypothetical protein
MIRNIVKRKTLEDFKICEFCEHWYDYGPSNVSFSYYHYCVKERDRVRDFYNIGGTEMMGDIKKYFPITHFKSTCPDFKKKGNEEEIYRKDLRTGWETVT